MGGWSKVEMAFWPDSKSVLDRPPEASSEPPIEWIELAVESLRW
jgi:hypothetical protein